MTKTFKAIEDNAGGLFFFVFADDACIYAGHGFQHNQGGILECIRAISLGEDPTDWEGDENAAQSWADMESSMERWPLGYKIVADQDGTYPDRMGVAASMEFGIS